MPIEIELPSDSESISLEEYVRRLDEGHFNLADSADLIASASLLKKLSNNKDFLIQFAFAELRRSLRFQETNMYGPQVLLLHTTNEYFIRANIWKPVTQIEQQVPGYRYDICHDHNFDILTVGYIGPGYRSRTYTYNRSECKGFIGERVTLVSDGIFTLTEGKVALYRANHDIHMQLPPEKLSVSINLVPRGRSQNDLQFEIDEVSGTICRYLDFSGAEVAVRFAGLSGKHEYLAALAEISQNHPSSKIRALALVSRLRINQDDKDIWDEIYTHPPLDRHIVDCELGLIHPS